MSDAPERRWSFWQWLGLAFLLYAVPAIVFAVDAEFFDGYLFTSLPKEVMALIKSVYWPLETVGKLWIDD